MLKSTTSVLEIIRDNNVSMKHVFELGLRARAGEGGLTAGAIQKQYDSMCSYISQRQIPSKRHEAVMREGLAIHILDLIKAQEDIQPGGDEEE